MVSAKKVLVIHLRQWGDILLTTPCLKAIKEEYSEHQIVFLSHPMGKLILKDCPYIYDHWTLDKGFGETLVLLKKIRAFGFHQLIDFMANPRSALISALSGIKVKGAFSGRRSFAYNVIEPRPDPSPYIVEGKFRLLRRLGYQPNSDVGLILPWFEQDTQVLWTLLRNHYPFLTARLRIAISPTHRREVRRWPLEHYAALADRLVKEWGAHILWLWGPGEEAVADHCISLCRAETSKIPTTSFRQMAAVMANCDAMIGNSNGPSHVAVATDICSLTLHGPTESWAWSPLTSKHQAIQGRYGKELAANLNQITIDEVWKKLGEMKTQILAQAEKRQRLGVKEKWR